MKLLFLDFETYYSDDYSLKNMTPVEYILDPRFAVNGCAVKEGLDGVPFWLDGPDFGPYLQRLAPRELMCISHNALFDSSILAWRYDFHPRLTCCTMSVAQATRKYALTSTSLDSVSKHLGIGVKGDALSYVKGMDLAAIKASGMYERYVNYALDDVTKCAEIFKHLVVGSPGQEAEFPKHELLMLDMTLRMTTQPVFRLDPTILAQHLGNVLAAKQQALDVVGTDVKAIRQDEYLAALLRAQGVEPPTKRSPTTGLTRYAFAKTDEEFLKLEEHPDPMVQGLVTARLGAKSTIEETRTQRFINISNLTWWPFTPLGNMPMPVRFSGAHTHRLSGDWKLNVQNLTRGGMLRKALIAPEGYKVVIVDSSQIEARLVAFLANQEDLLQQFENREDVYSNFASKIFYRTITKADTTERFIGKTSVLGLGFGMWWLKFQKQVKIMSKNQLGNMIQISDDESMKIVNTYRNTFPEIPQTWGLLINEGIPALCGRRSPLKFGPVVIEKEKVYMPGRLAMHYKNIRFEQVLGWVYTYSGNTKRIYGGKLLENIVQYLDRIIVMDAALRIDQRFAKLGWDYHLAQQAHDENGYVVRTEHVEQVKQILMEEMCRRPDWGAKLPLMSEVGVGDSYGDAK